MSSELLSLGELAKRLRVSTATLRAMVRDGRLKPTLALSSHTKRFDPEDVQRQLAPAAKAAPVHKPAAPVVAS